MTSNSNLSSDEKRIERNEQDIQTIFTKLETLENRLVSTMIQVSRVTAFILGGIQIATFVTLMIFKR